ncbi:MAG: sulfatase-like hydrolase/transferase, partial [Halobacteriales archaeon]
MASDDARPNVLLLTAHDMGRYLGCYGRRAQTPNLDALAADGALFESFFCTTPHCAPSRASVQTGLLPHNHGMMGHPIRDTDTASPRREPYKGWEIDEGIRTLPMYLNERGYDTHLAVYQHASGIPER